MAYVKELQIEKIFLFAVLLHMSFLFAFFLSGEKENAGIAALCRGFLTMDDGKRAALSRDAHR